MKPLPISLAVIAACGLFTEPALAAGKSKVREKATLTVEFLLQPGVDSPTGASGKAIVNATRKNGVETGKLNVELLGLPAGEYSLEATKTDDTTAVLGTVSVTGSEDSEGGSSQTKVELMAPAGVNVLDIESVAVLDAEETEVLSGFANATTTLWKYFANVRVTAPVAATEPEVTDGAESTDKGGKGGSKPKAKGKVNGHVLAKSTIKDDEETKRQFLFVAKGAPASTLLQIVVNGEEVDEVESTPAGKVMFKEDLIEDVVIQTITNISLVDPLGVVVMEANF